MATTKTIKRTFLNRKPSDLYFKNVKTKEDWEKLRDSGMAWEIDPDFPSTWKEHQQLVAERNYVQGMGVTDYVCKT